MAIPKKGIILDLIEPHECGPKVDLEKKFSTNECLMYVPEVKKKSVQILNDLDKPSDLRSREFIKETKSIAPLNILDQIKSNLKGGIND
jgi:hypothetical protein